MASANIGTIRAPWPGTNRRAGCLSRMNRNQRDQAAKPLLKIDKTAKALFKPYHESAPVKVLDTLGEVGDQLQLRLICSGVIAAGLLRADRRLAGTGVRMLLAHELATFAKGMVKRRVDRVRPRSTSGRPASRPRKGRSTAKEKQSFPSGHSAGSMAVACALGAGYPQYRAPAIAAAGAVALVQIPTCAHYPSDVMAGSALGVVSERALALLGRGLRALAMAALR